MRACIKKTMMPQKKMKASSTAPAKSATAPGDTSIRRRGAKSRPPSILSERVRAAYCKAVRVRWMAPMSFTSPVHPT